MVLSERKKIYISPENAPYDFNAHKTQRISLPAGRNFLFCNVFNSVSAGTTKKFSFVFFPIRPDDSAEFFQTAGADNINIVPAPPGDGADILNTSVLKKGHIKDLIDF